MRLSSPRPRKIPCVLLAPDTVRLARVVQLQGAGPVLTAGVAARAQQVRQRSRCAAIASQRAVVKMSPTGQEPLERGSRHPPELFGFASLKGAPNWEDCSFGGTHFDKDTPSYTPFFSSTPQSSIRPPIPDPVKSHTPFSLRPRDSMRPPIPTP